MISSSSSSRGPRAQRAHQRDPLLLATGQPVGVLADVLGQAEPAEQLARRGLRLAPGPAVHLRGAPACSCPAPSGAGTGCRPGRPCPSGCAPRAGRPAGRRSRAPRSRSRRRRCPRAGSRQRSSVDLPDPDEPIRHTTSRGLDGQVDVGEHHAVAVRLAQAARPPAAASLTRHRAPARSRSATRRCEPVGEPGQRHGHRDEEARRPRRTACS